MNKTVKFLFQFWAGIYGLASKWVVCGSHDVVNVYKLAEKNMMENLKAHDGNGKCVRLLFFEWIFLAQW